MRVLHGFTPAHSLAIIAVALFAPYVQAEQEETPTTEPAPAVTMFPKGLWTVQFTGAYYESIEANDETVATGAASVDYYFDVRHAVRMEVVGYCFDNDLHDDPADHPAAIGLNVGLRYQFLEHEQLTLFVEGLVGLFQANHKFPEGGTYFNFNEQLGLGATFRLYENVHLIGGARFLHISNAAIEGVEHNPGFNGVGGYVGLLFTF